MRPIGSESVSIQEHINILEAYSQSYQSCVSPLCVPITGNLLDGANKQEPILVASLVNPGDNLRDQSL